MEILRELTRLQHDHGMLDEAVLRDVSERLRVPLYRLEGLVEFYPAFRTTPPPRITVRVCRDVACAMADGAGCRHRLIERLGERDDVDVCEVSCLGRCDAAPAATIDAPGPPSLHEAPIAPATLADLESILRAIDAPETRRGTTASVPHGSWKCDPYANRDNHYGTVRSRIADDRGLGEVCIERLLASGLRGMGGAGFPTGRKWELVAKESSDTKFVICNADESEPGTFKDREILRQLPHLIIEGMLLAGLTIGATRGIVYLRHEYAREQVALEAALAEARQKGVLGSDAASSGQAFDIEIFVSPGGYILGEETALLEALEDRRGEPRNKPPYPGTSGLEGQPTLINNVETFAFATAIIHHGSDWWHAQGRGDFSGLKVTSISGDIAHAGVFEVPMGTPVSELIAQAGGMMGGAPLHAFLPGGASSNFLPAGRADTPLDFEAMREAGSMLGTGAVLVLAEGRDLFALATNLVRFFRNESCGKCVPCRLGSEQGVRLLEGVQAGNLAPEALEVLPDLGATLEQTSICGLGQVALNPILSMMRHFPDEVPR